MALGISGIPPEDRAEQLLRSLEGVLAARIVTDDGGRPVEIHILAPPDIRPKQVVRNVESALSAGLGIEIDRRIVSVARTDTDPALNGSATESPEPEDERVPAQAAGAANGAGNGDSRSAHGERLVLAGFDAHRDAARRVACTVSLQRQDDEFAGTGEGPDTPQGRAEAGARAAFAALSRVCEDSPVALEGVSLVRAHGRTYIQIAAHGLTGRTSTSLTGTAALHRSAEEAGVLAALQATNRWVRLPA